MACRVEANSNNFVRWQKIIGSLSLAQLQQNGIPDFCDFTNSFITQWDTTISAESASNQIELPLIAAGTYAFSVDWGDGSLDIITSHTDVKRLHTYTVAGVKTIKISGTLTGWNFASAFGQDDKEKLTLISRWGSLKPTNLVDTFRGCVNLDLTAIDTPDLSLVTTLEGWFRDCALLIGTSANFNWNVGAVTVTKSMFFGATVFNGNISSWNVSAVTDMASMFRSITVFNGDISGWDVSAVTTMDSMFDGATAFNASIGGWDVGAVTTTNRMFVGATAFNASIGGWNVGAVTIMTSMFNGATAFSKNLGGWDITAVTDMTNMFNGVTLSTGDYSNILIDWEGQAVQNNVTFNGGNSTYSAGPAAAARANLIADHIWVITDGGAE